MKKLTFFSIVILSVLILSLGGCTPRTASSSSEGVTITFWHNYDGAQGQIDVLNRLIAQFENENPGIKVDHLYLEWSALRNNVMIGVTTRMLPDVLRGDIAFVPQFQSLNVLYEMSSLPGYADIAANLLAAPNSTAKMGNSFYGIASNTNTKILFYNQDIMNEAGLSAARTFDELWAQTAILSRAGRFGFVEAWTGVWNVGQYIWSNGGDILSPDNSTASGYLNGSIAVATLQSLADLYAARHLTGPTLDPGAMGDGDGFTAGVYVMTIDGPWRAISLERAGINYGAAPLPSGPAGAVGVLGGENLMMFQTSSAENQAAAWKFIQFMVSKDPQVEMAKAGQMPVNIEAISDPAAIEAMPLLPVFAQSLQAARSRPVTPRWSEIEDIIAMYVNEAITGVKPVQRAMDEAVEAINIILR